MATLSNVIEVKHTHTRDLINIEVYKMELVNGLGYKVYVIEDSKIQLNTTTCTKMYNTHHYSMNSDITWDSHGAQFVKYIDHYNTNLNVHITKEFLGQYS